MKWKKRPLREILFCWLMPVLLIVGVVTTISPTLDASYTVEADCIQKLTTTSAKLGDAETKAKSAYDEKQNAQNEFQTVREQVKTLTEENQKLQGEAEYWEARGKELNIILPGLEKDINDLDKAVQKANQDKTAEQKKGNVLKIAAKSLPAYASRIAIYQNGKWHAYSCSLWSENASFSVRGGGNTPYSERCSSCRSAQSSWT